MISKLFKWIINLTLIAILVTAGTSLFLITKAKLTGEQTPSVIGYMPMSVLSGSMRPALEPGDMIISKHTTPENIAVGDVITFRGRGNMLITHRVTEILRSEGFLMFRTKGDANNVEDDNPVSQNQLVGIQVLRIPYGGYIVDFIGSPSGLVIFIAVPALLLITGELRRLLKASQKQELASEEGGAADNN